MSTMINVYISENCYSQRKNIEMGEKLLGGLMADQQLLHAELSELIQDVLTHTHIHVNCLSQIFTANLNTRNEVRKAIACV